MAEQNWKEVYTAAKDEYGQKSLAPHKKLTELKDFAVEELRHRDGFYISTLIPTRTGAQFKIEDERSGTTLTIASCVGHDQREVLFAKTYGNKDIPDPPSALNVTESNASQEDIVQVMAKFVAYTEIKKTYLQRPTVKPTKEPHKAHP